MAIDALFVVSRFVHLFAASVLFGAACFPFYGFASSPSHADEFPSWLRPFLLSAALCTLASGVVWFLVLAADRTGSLLAVGHDAIVATVQDMNFGWVWPLRLLLATVLLLFLLGYRETRRQLQLVLIASLVLLASLALTGNAANNEGSTGFQHRLMDAAHLVASGIWIGALAIFALLAVLSVRHFRDSDVRMFHTSLLRFSEVGTVAVAILTFSGMLNPAFFLSSLQTTYGQLLLVKVGVFVAMLALAALNRFWLVPRFSAALEAAGQGDSALRLLRTSIVLEGALAVLVFALVAWVGTLPSPT